MAIAERELKRPKVLTYEDYLTEGEIPGHYEIINGVRQFMTSPNTYHQVIAQNIYVAFRTYTKTAQNGRAFVTAIDIVTGTDPLQVRQPDAMLFSDDRWDDRGPDTPMPITEAPELVVEIRSPSNTLRSITAKMREYAAVGVRECWLVKSSPKGVEVWALAADAEPKLVSQTVTDGTVTSLAFPNLAIDIGQIFEY